jgi:hypothetical protein
MGKKIITLGTFPKHIIKKNIRGILTSTLEGFQVPSFINHIDGSGQHKITGQGSFSFH